MKKIDRLQFLQLAAGVLGAGVATAAAACGGDDSASGGGATCSATAPTATFSQNHGHTLTIPGADVTAAMGKTYTTEGMATHTHTVMVSGANFQDLVAGKSIMTSTSVAVDGHSHTVTIC